MPLIDDHQLYKLLESACNQPIGLLLSTVADTLMYHKEHRELFNFLPAQSAKGLEAHIGNHNLPPHVQSILDNLINPNYNNIGKLVYRTAWIGIQYGNVVSNQRARENNFNEFDAEALWGGFGEHVTTNIVRHQEYDTLYLAFLPRQNLTGDVLTRTPEWFRLDNHDPIDYEDIKNYLPNPKEGTKRQQTDKPIAWRTVELKNILIVKMRGIEYHLDKLLV